MKVDKNNSKEDKVELLERDAASIPVVTSASLLNDRREAVILHGAERYRLRLTASGKLILTK